MGGNEKAKSFLTKHGAMVGVRACFFVVRAFPQPWLGGHALRPCNSHVAIRPWSLQDLTTKYSSRGAQMHKQKIESDASAMHKKLGGKPFEDSPDVPEAADANFFDEQSAPAPKAAESAAPTVAPVAMPTEALTASLSGGGKEVSREASAAEP